MVITHPDITERKRPLPRLSPQAELLAEVIELSRLRRSVMGVEDATLQWVDRFDTRSLRGPIGDTPPLGSRGQYLRRSGN